VAADAAAQIRALAWTDPAAAADAAWATSDTLHVAAATLGRRILRQAADAYDRAARSPYGCIPPPTPAGNRLRQAARLLSAFAYLTGDRSLTPIVLITKLAALAEAVAELRESQRHAAQAAAARAAAERLYAATRPAAAPPPRSAPRVSTAARLAALSFPPTTPGRQLPAPGQPGPDQGGPRPSRGRLLLQLGELVGHAVPVVGLVHADPDVDQASYDAVRRQPYCVTHRHMCHYNDCVIITTRSHSAVTTTASGAAPRAS
jgi:hypothetical protein